MLLVNFIAGMSIVIAIATGRTDICATGMIAIVCLSGAETFRNLLTLSRNEEN